MKCLLAQSVAGGHYGASLLAIVTGGNALGIGRLLSVLPGGQYLIASGVETGNKVLASSQMFVLRPKSEGDAPSYSDTGLQPEHCVPTGISLLRFIIDYLPVDELKVQA